MLVRPRQAEIGLDFPPDAYWVIRCTGTLYCEFVVGVECLRENLDDEFIIIVAPGRADRLAVETLKKCGAIFVLSRF